MTWNNSVAPSAIDTSTTMGTLVSPNALSTGYDITLNASKVQSQNSVTGGHLSVEFDETASDDFVIGSRESTTQPQLIVTYTTPTPSPTPTKTPSPRVAA